jgi:hypothetical protein
MSADFESEGRRFDPCRAHQYQGCTLDKELQKAAHRLDPHRYCQRTFAEISELCRDRWFRERLAGALLDHLGRPQQRRRRDREAQRFGGLEVDDQLELGGLLDGEIGGLVPWRILST